MIKAVLALAVVLGLIGISALAFAKAGGGKALAKLGNRRIKIIETAPLGGKTRLTLFSCDGAEYLIVTGENSHSVISRKEDGNEK